MDLLLYKAAFTVARGLFRSAYAPVMRDVYGDLPSAALYASYMRRDLVERYDPDKISGGSEERLRFLFYCKALRNYYAIDIRNNNIHNLTTPSGGRTGRYLVPRRVKQLTGQYATRKSNSRPGSEERYNVIDALEAPSYDLDNKLDAEELVRRIRELDLSETQEETLDLLLRGLTPGDMDRELGLKRGVSYQRVNSLINRIRSELSKIYGGIDFSKDFKTITGKPGRNKKGAVK